MSERDDPVKERVIELMIERAALSALLDGNPHSPAGENGLLTDRPRRKAKRE